jgi:hypothetical protein
MGEGERETLLSEWHRALDRAKGWAAPGPAKEAP